MTSTIQHQKLFRTSDGQIKEMLSHLEGISFQENPLDFFILLARYKFAARLIKKKMSVLDAGCGQGAGTLFLSKFAAHITGGDFDKALVERNNDTYKDIENINFKFLDLLTDTIENQYDVVVSMDVIEHFTKEQTEIVAQNYAALTKDGGFAIIGTPNIASAPYASERRKQSHLHEFEPAEFEDLLRKNFKNVFLFSMTDEVVSLSFPKLAWYLMALCVK
jgi:2-polyprenyl-3-methyl-5-hydroxy-6-metoxy-1,4-benzoquinol methylase